MSTDRDKRVTLKVGNFEYFTYEQWLKYLKKLHSNMLAFIDMLFLVGCFTCDPDSFELVYWGTCHRSKRGGLIVA